jgi:hypothetical protein
LDTEVHRIAAELRAGGQAEAVGFKSLRGYSPTYMEIDGVPVEVPPPDRREAPGIRVLRPNGEIALYVTATMERARWLLAEAQRVLAEARRIVEADSDV